MFGARTFTRITIKAAEDAVWQVVGDAVIAVFMVEVVQDVQLFDMRDPFPAGLIG